MTAAGQLAPHLFSTATMLLAARLLGAAGGFGVQLLLARLLPAGALGLYFAGASLAMVAAVIAAGGYNSIATRFVTRYRGRQPLLAAFVRQAQRSNLAASLGMTAAIVAWAALWPGLAPAARWVFAAAAASIPPLAWVRLHGSFATAIKSFKLAYLPDVCLKPVVVLAVLAVLALAGVALSATLATIVLTLATAALAAAQYRLLRPLFPADLGGWRRRAAATVRLPLAHAWRREARTLILVALFTQYFADIAVLAATPLMAPAELGRFGLALKLAFLIGFFVQLGQQIATPDIAASLRESRSTRALDRRLRVAAWSATGLTLAATLAAALWGDDLLRFFGADYTGGGTALVILVAAQVLRAAFGPGTAVLTLLGRQMLNLRLAALALAVLAVTTAALAPTLGATGAAIAVFLATLAWCTTSALMLSRKARIRVDAFRLATSHAA
ncbi:MAG TPA: polysaccharide biosynthesis C-terminal domain-containing protein [Hyphomicrobiales bacterium]|nr:polysaccharide biosynthesis C-terminal domain-containing protein [Hyphomicrobiales bacterium]